MNEEPIRPLSRFVQNAAVMLREVPLLRSPNGADPVYDKTSPQWQVYQDWLATQPEEFRLPLTFTCHVLFNPELP